jgi:glucosamine kinase
MKPRYFLALDIGGSKTTCALADERQVLCTATAGSAKILRVGEREAVTHLREVLDAVSQQSDIALSEITSSCIGTSGAVIPRVADWLRSHMTSWVGGTLTLLGDEIITLDAAFPGEAGIAVIAGTGSNVIGRSRSGHITGAGGWGPALADEGSGNLLGQQALRAIFAAINAAPESREAQDPPLLCRVLDYLRLETRDDLIAAANAMGFSFAQLVPQIVLAAREGDSIAQATLERGGVELGGLVLHVVGRLAAAEPGIENGLRIACTGSIMKYVPEVTGSMHRVLLNAYPQLHLVPGIIDPLEGALWHARQAAAVAA